MVREALQLDTEYLFEDGGWIGGRNAGGELERQAHVEKEEHGAWLQLWYAPAVGFPRVARELWTETWQEALELARRWCSGTDSITAWRKGLE